MSKVYDYVVDPEDGQCVIYSKDDQGKVEEVARVDHEDIQDIMSELREN